MPRGPHRIGHIRLKRDQNSNSREGDHLPRKNTLINITTPTRISKTGQ
jgi:hypothetical protein